MDQHFFGSPEHQAVARKAADLWTLVQDDPRFATHGRTVALNAQVTTDMDLLLAMMRLQGVSSIDGLPDEQLSDFQAMLDEQNLESDLFVNWLSGPDAVDICEAYLAHHHLPDDLELLTVDTTTPVHQLSEIAELLTACEMMLPMERFVRGQAQPSVYLAALDRSGRPVSHASSTGNYHRDAPNGQCAHWGMLATVPTYRGRGLAAYLGARALVEMHRKHGYTSFYTGIRSGNVSSEKLCGMLGLAPTPTSILLAIDPSAFGDNTTITK